MLDLHTHSTYSDGTLSPRELALAGEASGLVALALTDHDTVAGIPEFLAACASLSLEGIPGVELSASWYGGSLHIVGLFVDARCPELASLLASVRENRICRNCEMLRRLAVAGVCVSAEEVAAEAGVGVVGRPHIASLLVKKGYCRTRREAFENWLGSNRPGYVRRYLPLPEEVIATIHRAGGKAIMGHPFGNPRGESVSKVRKSLKSLVALGLDGLEVYYSDHTPEETAAAEALARFFKLRVSGGSDYHGGNSPGIELGVGRGNLHVPDDLLSELLVGLNRG